MAQLNMSEEKWNNWFVRLLNCSEYMPPQCKMLQLYNITWVRISESSAQKAFILFKKSLDTEYIIVCWYTQSDMKTAKNIY